MPFDFHGTFNRSQLTRFLAFARGQKVYIQGRLAHLEAESERVGQLLMLVDANGTPLAFQATPTGSYVANLFQAYVALGGNPFFDLQVRSASQPVFLLKGDESTAPQLFSNGEVMGRGYLLDADSASFMAQGREWLEETFRTRLGALERKIRRALDYRDQLVAETRLLALVGQGVDTEGSLDSVASELETLLGDPLYRAIYDDLGKDPHGKMTSAPFAGYNTTGEATDTRAPQEEYVKTSEGVVVPGRKTPLPPRV